MLPGGRVEGEGGGGSRLSPLPSVSYYLEQLGIFWSEIFLQIIGHFVTLTTLSRLSIVKKIIEKIFACNEISCGNIEYTL